MLNRLAACLCTAVRYLADQRPLGRRRVTAARRKGSMYQGTGARLGGRSHAGLQCATTFHKTSTHLLEDCLGVLQQEIRVTVSDSSGFSNTGDKTCSNRLYCADTAVVVKCTRATVVQVCRLSPCVSSSGSLPTSV